MSYRKPTAALAAVLTLAATFAASSALAQPPRQLSTSATPRAAAPTLGMAILSAYFGPMLRLEGGAGVVGAVRESDSNYFVAFNRSVEGCVFAGSVGGPFLASSHGFLMMKGEAGTFNGETYYGVRVLTADTRGEVSDRPFYLLVFCAE